MHKGRKFTLLITHGHLADRNEIISRYWLLLRWTSRSIDLRGKYWPRWSQGQYLPQRTGNLNAHQYIKVICEFLHTFPWHNIMKAPKVSGNAQKSVLKVKISYKWRLWRVYIPLFSVTEPLVEGIWCDFAYGTAKVTKTFVSSHHPLGGAKNILPNRHGYQWHWYLLTIFDHRDSIILKQGIVSMDGKMLILQEYPFDH